MNIELDRNEDDDCIGDGGTGEGGAGDTVDPPPKIPSSHLLSVCAVVCFSLLLSSLSWIV